MLGQPNTHLQIPIPVAYLQNNVVNETDMHKWYTPTSTRGTSKIL